LFRANARLAVAARPLVNLRRPSRRTLGFYCFMPLISLNALVF
jgi:hypothetical protein